jgi:hypothetical protein
VKKEKEKNWTACFDNGSLKLYNTRIKKWKKRDHAAIPYG